MNSRLILSLILLFVLAACKEQCVPEHYEESSALPIIYPDYVDVTIPVNMAPLHFQLMPVSDQTEVITRFRCGDEELVCSGRKAMPSISDWQRLINNNEELRVNSEESFGKDNSGVELGMAETNSSLSSLHPELQTAQYQVQASKHEWRQARASLFPSLSLSAGLNTTYYKTLHSETAASFRNQLKNNMGEFVGATVSIPLFNRLQTITNIRKAKNNYRIAQEALEQKQLELEKLSREAWQDWHGYLKQTVQMEKKVEADSIAYQLTKRQFEEGLSTAIDLHTTSTQLLKSKATLLQCQLMAMVKEQLVRYYRGEKIWE